MPAEPAILMGLAITTPDVREDLFKSNFPIEKVAGFWLHKDQPGWIQNGPDQRVGDPFEDLKTALKEPHKKLLLRILFTAIANVLDCERGCPCEGRPKPEREQAMK